jgi:hypothetical protein
MTWRALILPSAVAVLVVLLGCLYVSGFHDQVRNVLTVWGADPAPYLFMD